MAEASQERKTGCGLLNAVFGKNKPWRRSASSGSLASQNSSGHGSKASTTIPNSKRRKGSSDDGAFLQVPTSEQSPNNKPSITVRNAPNHQKMPPVYQQADQAWKPPSSGRTKVTQATNDAAAGRLAAPQKQGQVNGQGRKVMKESLGISGELESMIAEHQKAKGGNANLVRASSGNVMLYSHLGNLRQPGGGSNNGYTNSNLCNQTANNNNNATPAAKYANTGMGNIVKKQNNEQHQQEREEANPLCRALSCRMDPEELKIMGNEDYKNGRFAEALVLYERAIDLDPTKASYRSNKSAALTALGRLLEAVFECREAIRLDPRYQRAHLRLANLYLRLGEAEKAVYHFKQAGPEADPDAMMKAKTVLAHLTKCDDAKRLKDWNAVLKEAGNAIAAGADSGPSIFALQAEALLKLQRHEEADKTMTNGPSFAVDQCTKFFGPAGNAALLVIRAQVDVAAGRFDEAVAAVQQAAKLDASNRDVNSVSRRAKAVAAARAQGNDLFKASRYAEAAIAYGHGLEHDPYNSVLLCNRAACRSKLSQYEKAVEDCSSALNVRPSYGKARRRRADCNAKLEKWEAALQDYEVLMIESPGDEEVGKALFEAQKQLRKQGGDDVSGMKFGDNEVVVIRGEDRFRQFTTLPGLSIVIFCNKPGNRPMLHFMDRLCKRYPTIKFLKVEVEDNPSLTKSEGASTLPVFKIYKNGSRVKEIPGDDHESLETSLKDYMS
ncbi:hypothetical protein Ancab_026340 [Ancistrocladus abbreviatus]